VRGAEQREHPGDAELHVGLGGRFDSGVAGLVGWMGWEGDEGAEADSCELP